MIEEVKNWFKFHPLVSCLLAFRRIRLNFRCRTHRFLGTPELVVGSQGSELYDLETLGANSRLSG